MGSWVTHGITPAGSAFWSAEIPPSALGDTNYLLVTVGDSPSVRSKRLEFHTAFKSDATPFSASPAPALVRKTLTLERSSWWCHVLRVELECGAARNPSLLMPAPLFGSTGAPGFGEFAGDHTEALGVASSTLVVCPSFAPAATSATAWIHPECSGRIRAEVAPGASLAHLLRLHAVRIPSLATGVAFLAIAFLLWGLPCTGGALTALLRLIGPGAILTLAVSSLAAHLEEVRQDRGTAVFVNI